MPTASSPSPIDTSVLQKALNTLKKCHADVAESHSTQKRLEAELALAETDITPYSSESVVNSITAGRVRLSLLPKFTLKVILQREEFSDNLRAAIEPTWQAIESALRADQDDFRNKHQTELIPLFGSKAREILDYSPLIPCPNWKKAEREALSLFHKPGNASADRTEDYPRDLAYDTRLIEIAERVLAIAANYKIVAKAA